MHFTFPSREKYIYIYIHTYNKDGRCKCYQGCEVDWKRASFSWNWIYPFSHYFIGISSVHDDETGIRASLVALPGPFRPRQSLNERAAEEAARFFPAIPSSPLSHLFPPLFPACIPVACPSGKGFVEIEGERERDGRVISPIFRTRVFAIEQLINALATVAPAPVVNCYSVQIELCPTCWKGGGGRIIIRTIIILALNVNICGLKRKKKRGYIFFFSRFSFLSACPVQEFRKVNCNKNLAKYFARVSLKKGKKRIWSFNFSEIQNGSGNVLFNPIPKYE